MNRPVIHVIPLGRMANRMIQYMAAIRLASLIPGAVIGNVDLPEWGISLPGIPPPEGAPHRVVKPEDGTDMNAVVAALCDGTLERVYYSDYGQRMASLLPPDAYREVFQAPQIEVETFGDDILLCSVRGGDILDGHHRDYVLIPPEFYQELVAVTGLTPVFIGQIGRNNYTARLRRAFPQARFIESRGALADFETLRRASNIVPSISTFAWLAAWLSEARQIVLPVAGLFQPMQCRQIDLLPLDDPRYRFFLFPITYATPVQTSEAAHQALLGLWREVSPAMLTALRASQPRFARSEASHLPLFDEAYYRSANPDVAAVVAAGGFASGRDHYLSNGFAERRSAFAFDTPWYSRRYPLAAFEVGQGDFIDLADHYAEIGRRRGYRPLPDDA